MQAPQPASEGAAREDTDYGTLNWSDMHYPYPLDRFRCAHGPCCARLCLTHVACKCQVIGGPLVA